MVASHTGAASAARSGVNVYGSRLRSLTLAALAPLVFMSCACNADVADAPGECHEQIILSLAPGYTRTDQMTEALSRDADVHLEYLRSASPTLFVFRLTASGEDSGCTNALARLRQDSRVRFVELDVRRTRHGL